VIERARVDFSARFFTPRFRIFWPYRPDTGLPLGTIFQVAYAGGINSVGWIGLIGTALGAIIAITATEWSEHRRRLRDLENLKVSLYAEIADRVCRCGHDYLRRWGDLK
jgi:hypothetical protein